MSREFLVFLLLTDLVLRAAGFRASTTWKSDWHCHKSIGHDSVSWRKRTRIFCPANVSLTLLDKIETNDCSACDVFQSFNRLRNCRARVGRLQQLRLGVRCGQSLDQGLHHQNWVGVELEGGGVKEHSNLSSWWEVGFVWINTRFFWIYRERISGFSMKFVIIVSRVRSEFSQAHVTHPFCLHLGHLNLTLQTST